MGGSFFDFLIIFQNHRSSQRSIHGRGLRIYQAEPPPTNQMYYRPILTTTTTTTTTWRVPTYSAPSFFLPPHPTHLLAEKLNLSIKVLHEHPQALELLLLLRVLQPASQAKPKGKHTTAQDRTHYTSHITAQVSKEAACTHAGEDNTAGGHKCSRMPKHSGTRSEKNNLTQNPTEKIDCGIGVVSVPTSKISTPLTWTQGTSNATYSDLARALAPTLTSFGEALIAYPRHAALTGRDNIKHEHNVQAERERGGKVAHKERRPPTCASISLEYRRRSAITPSSVWKSSLCRTSDNAPWRRETPPPPPPLSPVVPSPRATCIVLVST